MTNQEDPPPPPASRERWLRWIAGGLLAVLLLACTLTIERSSPFVEADYAGWPAITYVQGASSYREIERGEKQVRGKVEWLAPGIAINLVLAAAVSGAIMAWYGAVRDGRITIRMLLWLTLCVAVFLGGWTAAQAHNLRYLPGSVWVK
jgi:hypothetical protein